MCLESEWIEGHGKSREEFNRGRWEGEGWEKVPEGGIGKGARGREVEGGR